MKSFKIFLKVSCISIIILSHTSCATSQIISKPIPNNPIAYTYRVSITNADSLYKLFKESYVKYHSTLELYVSDIFYNGDGYTYARKDEKNKYLSNENKDDICMTVKVDSSKIYFNKNGKRLEYIMQCRLHQVRNTNGTTKLEVQVLDSKVHTRDKLLPSPPHFVNDPVYKKVMPTTIEEYKILLCIGKAVDLSNEMPPIMQPY